MVKVLWVFVRRETIEAVEAEPGLIFEHGTRTIEPACPNLRRRGGEPGTNLQLNQFVLHGEDHQVGSVFGIGFFQQVGAVFIDSTLAYMQYFGNFLV